MPDINILAAVKGKLTAQLHNTKAAHKQAVDSLQQADFEVESAARLLISKFGNPQGTVQIVQAVYQADTLSEIINEISEMLAAVDAQLPPAPPAVEPPADAQEEEQGVSAP
jgi:hypothetical protein